MDELEKFEDTKDVIKSCMSRMDKKHSNAWQNTTHKTDERRFFDSVSYVRFLNLGFDKGLSYCKALVMVRAMIRNWVIVTQPAHLSTWHGSNTPQHIFKPI